MAVKTIYLLRHGQYTSKPNERLTPLGRKQAKRAGKRLQFIKFHKVFFSTMPRAQETAEIVHKYLHFNQQMQGAEILHERIPGFPKNLRKQHGYTDLKKLNAQKHKAEIAFKTFFKVSRTNRNELIVCHGNIIRFFLCKVLKIETDRWLHFDIKQCGITVITIDSKRRSLRVISHNDGGHIPLHEQTFI
jgi:serine/threonine-protein phosphatase PGAM5